LPAFPRQRHQVISLGIGYLVQLTQVADITQRARTIPSLDPADLSRRAHQATSHLLDGHAALRAQRPKRDPQLTSPAHRAVNQAGTSRMIRLRTAPASVPACCCQLQPEAFVVSHQADNLLPKPVRLNCLLSSGMTAGWLTKPDIPACAAEK
jgi:hypothetical protein